mmetsp:Transcript_110328/g.213635  ORF Transcript_110328/g.213635 Transcript_110328/m.213635 type:complete len:438 (+) Transcript_110328:154-1467(+)
MHVKPRQGIWCNCGQAALQLALAALIGVTFRFVLLPAALLSDRNNKADYLIYFGVAKALSGRIGGSLADDWGRKKTCVLGWLLGFSMVPVLAIGFALHLSWVHNLAYLLLGAHQGVTWGLNITCLMDLFGPSGRGLASGLSNAVGYLASSACAPYAALLSDADNKSWTVAAAAASVLSGLLLTCLSTDTKRWAVLESVSHDDQTRHLDDKVSTGCETTSQALCSLAGLTVNMATALVWGSMVSWAKSPQDGALSNLQIGNLEAVHTCLKAIALCGSGVVVHSVGARPVVAVSLLTLAGGLAAVAWQARSTPADLWLILVATGLVGLGVGGAFPALAASASTSAPAGRRASAYGAYRMWRDAGYSAGGLLERLVAWDGFRSTSATVFAWSAVLTTWWWICWCSHLMRSDGHNESDSNCSSSSDTDSNISVLPVTGGRV